MTPGQRLRMVRTLRDMTQRQLAEVTGIPQPILSQMESDRLIPAGEWEERIKTALNWTSEMDTHLNELHEEAQ